MSEQHTQLQEEGKAPDQQKPQEVAEYAIIAVAAGEGIENKFKEYGVSQIVSGGQTMNPSTEDFVAAIKKCNAKKIFILPNNSNIVMAAQQACDVAPEGVEARVIPTKTIPQGLVACMMFNPESEMDDNENEMNEAIGNVKTGQVTFAIKDTSFEGVEVKKDQFIALFGKSIVCCYPEKIKTTLEMIENMVDDMTSIISLITGEDVTKEETGTVVNAINEKFPDIELEVIEGKQPVYSFIVGVE